MRTDVRICVTAPTIRRFTPADWRAYRDLRLRALEDSPDAFLSTHALEAQRADADWEARLRTDAESNLPLVAALDGANVGLAWGRRDASSRDVAHVFQMWVEPTARGLHIGELLLGAIIAWARALGIRRLVLGVNPSGTAAVRLYARVGFVATGDAVPAREGSALLTQAMQLDLT